MPVRYTLQIDSRWEKHAAYALDLLLECIGVLGLRVDDPATADLAYAVDRPPELPKQAVWIPADGLQDWNATRASCVTIESIPLFFHRRRPTADRLAVDALGDVVYSTYALATGTFEQSQAKDAWGVPVFSGSFLEECGALGTPAVAVYAHHLLERLNHAGCRPLIRVPQWPEGKHYAVVLSHDVDQPFSEKSQKYQVRRLYTAVRRSEWRSIPSYAKGLGGTVVRRLLARIPAADEDPNLCFDKWIEVERCLGTTSCFYVAVTSAASLASHPHDVWYDVRDPAIVKWLRHAVSEGWEIGLHASINSREDPARLQDERQRLEAQLDGYRLRGLRHHYWALDHDLPERTFWSHAAAGFEYDSSLGMNDRPGFRRGMAWPFQPFDREQARTVPILELPPTLMDGSIFYRAVTPEQGYQQILQHWNAVARYGGAMVLDWHLEQLNPARLRGAGPVLTRALMELALDSKIFWTSPAQLAAWWRSRHARLI